MTSARQLDDPDGAWWDALTEPERERRRHWGRFVRRNVDDFVAEEPGRTVDDLLPRLAFGKSTLYRWIRREWRRDPERSNVDSFCRALDIPESVAWSILEWGPGGTTKHAPSPTLQDPAAVDVDELLADPQFPDEDKSVLRGIIDSFKRRRST